jgi:hypothetical protein
MIVYDSLHSLPDYEYLLFHCDWFGSDLRIGHFFSFRCPLVNTPQMNNQFPNSLMTEWLNCLKSEHSWTELSWTELFWNELWALLRMNESVSLSQSQITTDGRSASLSWNIAPICGLRPDSYYCQTLAGLLTWSALSDERTGLSFTNAAGPRQRIIFGSESRGTRDHILLSQIRDFPFRRLLRLSRLRWRYSIRPPHGMNEWIKYMFLFYNSGRTEYTSPPPTARLIPLAHSLPRIHAISEPLASNGCLWFLQAYPLLRERVLIS